MPTSTSPTTPTQADGALPLALDDLPILIAEAHAASERAIQTGIEHAFRAGALLLQAKALVPHGKWLAWLKTNVAFTPRTAQNYMLIAGLDAEKAKRVSHSSFREALRALRKRNYLTAPEELKRESSSGPPVPNFDPATAPPSPPPVPFEPATPAQRADELVAQLDEAIILDGEMTLDHLRDAFARRFEMPAGSFSSVIDPIDTSASTVRNTVLATLDRLQPSQFSALREALADELNDIFENVAPRRARERAA